MSAGWFGEFGHHLFGWLHLPDSGTARGAVALCPPFGLEYLATHRTYRTFAHRLSRAGFAVLRFDWYGTGDSTGTLDDATVDGWLDDVGAALARLRLSGIDRTALVGMRLGATLAATAVDHGVQTDGLVLWDPCRSGRTFLREQRALYAVASADTTTAPQPLSTDAETLGFTYPEALADQLHHLDLAAADAPPPVPTLFLARTDRPIDKALSEWFRSDHVEREEAVGQAEQLDVGPSEARVPEAALDRITAWLTALWDDRRCAVTGDLEPLTTISGGVGRASVVERVTRLGSAGLFGIGTQPEIVPAGTATVVFIPVAAEHRVGPGRMWVELARDLAACGHPCLRFDLSGLGDSPARDGQAENWVYAPETSDDIDQVLEAISPTATGGIVLVGLCSGAHAAMKAVARSGNGSKVRSPAVVRRVCAVNPFLWYRGKPYLASASYQPSAVVAPVKLWLSRHAKERLRHLGDRLPESVWTAISRTPLARQPMQAPKAVVDAGVDLLLVLERSDAEKLARRFPTALRNVERSGRFRLVAPEGGDHSLFATRPREEVRRLVRQHIQSLTPAQPSDR